MELRATPSTPTREYIYSGGSLLAKIESGAVQYYHPDQLSVRLMTDSNGTVIGQQAYYPFGEQWYAQNTTTKWFFTAGVYPERSRRERDSESGNDYAMARYGVNRLGRFASPDPIAGSRSDPQSLNRYAYVLDDPVNLVDPLGLDCSWTNPDEPCNGGSGVGDGGYDPGAGDGMCSLPDTPCISPYFGPGTSPCSVNGIAVGCGAAAQIVHMGAANPPGEPDTYVEILGPLVPAVLPDFSCMGQTGCGVVLGWQQSVWLLPWNGSPSDVFGFLETLGFPGEGAPPPAANDGPSWWSRWIPRVPVNLSFIVPLLGIAGPAVTFTYLPQANDLCVAPGLGGSVGRNVSAGPLILGNVANAKSITEGASITVGAQVTPALGAQATGNLSGILGGPTVGVPGGSIAATYGVCF